MYNDLIKMKPKPATRLEKNGIFIENATIDMSEYSTTYSGYIECIGLQIAGTDCFMLHINTDGYKFLQYPKIVRIILTRLPDSRIKFTTFNK